MNLTAIFSMITFLLSFYVRPELHVKSVECLEQDTEKVLWGGDTAVGQDSEHQGRGPCIQGRRADVMLERTGMKHLCLEKERTM